MNAVYKVLNEESPALGQCYLNAPKKYWFISMMCRLQLQRVDISFFVLIIACWQGKFLLDLPQYSRHLTIY